jgi:hypothetical protein
VGRVRANISAMRTMIAFAAAAIAAGFAEPATAVDPEPANLGVQLLSTFDDATGQVHRSGAVAGRIFVLTIGVASSQLPTDPDDRPVDTKGVRTATYAIDFPAGLAVQRAATIRGGGYAGTSTICTSGCAVAIPDGRIGVTGHYRLLARSPGRYAVTIRLTSTGRPDPASDNDRATTEIVVKAPTVAVVAGRAVATPTVPRAGRPFALTLPLTRAGAPVIPASVRCTATLGGRVLVGARAALVGRARCTWRIPTGSAGAKLRATLVATARGQTFRAVRVAAVAR